LNFGFEEQPWRDEPFTPGPSLQLSKQVKQHEPERYNAEQLAKAARSNKWRELQAKLRPIKAKATGAMAKYWRSTERAVIRQIKSFYETMEQLDEAITKKIDTEQIIRDAIDQIDDEKLRKTMEPHIQAAITRGIDSVGITFALPDDRAIAMLNNRLSKIKEVNDTVIEQMRERLREALEVGMSEKQAAEALIDETKNIFSLAKHRAKTIARTEIHGAYSDSRYETMKSVEPVGKMWITARDAKVRDSHLIDGEVIPFDETFSNGLERPQDPNGSAEDVINCRCEMVLIQDPEEFEQRRT
jgi:SPP1 gp7 family putative phage head morphogenesis protein